MEALVYTGPEQLAFQDFADPQPTNGDALIKIERVGICVAIDGLNLCNGQIEINAAIGGCPSFPYGWCLKHFLGDNPDVVSWDFAMNEAGGDPMGLEAYLRLIWHDLRPHSNSGGPQLLVRDTHLAIHRRALLQNYSQWFPDAMTLHTDPAASPYLSLPEVHRPRGFQQWRKFGAPTSSALSAVAT